MHISSSSAYGLTDGDRSYDYAVIIGRFQPVHQGHAALLRAGLQHARKLIVVAGSMSQPRSFKNPFTVDERERMIRVVLPEHDQARVQVTGVSDAPYDDAAWLQAVQDAVYAAMRSQGDDPTTARVALLGHMKDQSSYYLRIFPNWQWQPFANVEGIDATAIRHSYFSDELLDEPSPHALLPLWQQPAVLPASTIDFLRTFRQTPAWQALHDERAFLLDFQRQHRYARPDVDQAAPVLCLVQTLVLWRQHILLVQRQQPPGQGNWALPEVLLQAGERLLDAASRALCALGGSIRPRPFGRMCVPRLCLMCPGATSWAKPSAMRFCCSGRTKRPRRGSLRQTRRIVYDGSPLRNGQRCSPCCMKTTISSPAIFWIPRPLHLPPRLPRPARAPASRQIRKPLHEPAPEARPGQ